MQPIIVVLEARVDVGLHVSGLTVELAPQIGDLHRLAVLVFALIGDLAGLGLPGPSARDIDARELRVPGIAYGVDLGERLEAVRVGQLFDDWRALLRLRTYSKNHYPKDRQKTYCSVAA